MTPKGRYFLYGVLVAQSVMLIVLGLLALSLRSQVHEQQDDSRFAETATCYAAARGRPKLIVILRGIAAKLDPDPRRTTLEFIDQYEASTPLVEDCDALAEKYGLSSDDFPPPTPRGEEGK
jgi:hypothetical protein